MADGTKIEWTDATVNAVNGCSVLSVGCTNCYAMKLAGTRLRNHPSRAGLTIATKAGPVWNGEVRLNEPALLQPLAWKRPRRIFWNAHGDLFHENVPDEWIDRCFASMALTPHHQHQLLTKRADRMRRYLTNPRAPYRIARDIIDMLVAKLIRFDEQTWPVISEGDAENPTDVLIRWPLPNVWLGVSVEDQRAADERIPHLLATPAAVRFLSCEPLLGPVDLTSLAFPKSCDCEEFSPTLDALEASVFCEGCCEGAERVDLGTIDWVIAGGESGPGARPMHPDWARTLRDQCADAGVPFFFKQWGEWAPGECACEPVLRTEQTAQLFEQGWHFSSITPKMAEELHCDDEPDLYRIGKRTAGRLLDGVEHNGMPVADGAGRAVA